MSTVRRLCRWSARAWREPSGLPVTLSVRGMNIDIFPGDDSPCTEVVGIVENHRRRVGENPDFLYFLNQGHPFPISQATLVVGTIGEAEPLVDLIRDEARAASTQIRLWAWAR